ncbi:hypothetical protein HZB88_05150 [archaeon]|nr:hypothetical protein [archaeon]
MLNHKIAGIFYKIAEILEIKNVKWKPQAYRRAAKELDILKEDIRITYKKGGIKAIQEIPGIGEGLAKKIVEYMQTSRIKEYEKVKRQVPKGLIKLLSVQGLGPKKVAKFYNELNIKSIKQLKQALINHKICGLFGFDEKAEQNILRAIEMMGRKGKKMPLHTALKTANKILNALKKCDAVLKIDAAGSLRRRKESVGDIDILASSTEPERVTDFFVKMKHVKIVLAKGTTKASVVLKNGMQSDLRVVEPKSYGAALLYFTGSKEYNIELRKIAIKKGYKLNEYGLFKGKKQIAGRTEEELFEKLGLKYVKPELREVD